MDPGLPRLLLGALVVCLLGATRCSGRDTLLCHSIDIPKLNTQLTQDPPTNISYPITGRYRYRCKDGFLRKAGTSDLLRCVEDDGEAKWSQEPDLECIRNPRWTTTTTPPPTPLTTVGSAGGSHAQGTTPVVSVSAETASAKTTTVGLHVPTNPTQGKPNSTFPPVVTEDVTKTETTSRTTTKTSASADPKFDESQGSDKSTTTAVAIGVSVLVVLAAIGCSIMCYIRRSRRSAQPGTVEEEMPMRQVPAGQEPQRFDGSGHETA